MNRGRASDSGAANELIVSADLISRGYFVFRSLVHTCPTDLVAIKDDRIIKIEVKTAVLANNGNIWKSKVPTEKGTYGYRDFDVLAFVCKPEGSAEKDKVARCSILYDPPLDDSAPLPHTVQPRNPPNPPLQVTPSSSEASTSPAPSLPHAADAP